MVGYDVIGSIIFLCYICLMLHVITYEGNNSIELQIEVISSIYLSHLASSCVLPYECGYATVDISESLRRFTMTISVYGCLQRRNEYLRKLWGLFVAPTRLYTLRTTLPTRPLACEYLLLLSY